MFDRKIIVEVGQLGATKAIALNGVHIRFDVSDGEGVDTKGEITIFNLSKATYQEIKMSKVLVLKAGHNTGNTPSVLFVGRISSVVPKREGGDVAYVIQCNGGTEARSKKVSKTYPKNVSVESVIRDLSKEMGMKLEVSDLVLKKIGLSTKTYKNGLTVHGRSADEIAEIAEDLGLEMRINDIKITLMEKGKTSPTTMLSVSTASGMIDYLRPELVLDGEVEKSGWKMKTVLMPDITRGARVQAIDPVYGVGVYRVVSKRHYGSNFETEFYTESVLLEA